MKIALIGYGKMGKEIEYQAIKRGDEIVAYFDAQSSSFAQVEQVDVCIDFTQSSAVLKTLQKLAPFKKPLVIGTTGWDISLSKCFAKTMGILYAPNFSLGVALFERLLKQAHQLLSSHYTLSGVEIHHKHKKDIPSGTALHLSRSIPDLNFQSVRIGSEIGSHHVIFDSHEEVIELTHRAKNRAGFAKGALDAAAWLIGKVGFYTFDDVIEEMFT